ncbi:MAG: Kelch repeat-containing protein [Anaerolineae bacterium]
MKPRIKFFFLLSAVFIACVLIFAQFVQATTATWTAKAPMLTARTWISAAAYDGKLYVFGGLNNTTKLATVERYDPGTNTWDSRADMPTARYGTGAATLNGKIYVIGGVHDTSVITNAVQVYDPISNTWASAAPIPTARCRLAVVAGADGRLYAIGGSTSSTVGMSGYSKVVEVYTPGTGPGLHLRP